MREAPFIAQGGPFPRGIIMETYGNRLMLIRSFFPPKLGRFGAKVGPADPVVRPAHEWRPSRRLASWTLPGGPPTCVCRCGALFVSFLCQMGLFLMCNAAAMFCVSLLCLLCVFMLFPTCVPAINNSPTLMEFVSNNSYHYC